MKDGDKSALAALGIVGLGIMVFIACCDPAKADVCTSANCATKKPVSAMVSSDPVTWCDGTSNGFTCSNPKPINWGGTADFTRILTDTGYFRKDSIPATTAQAPFVYKPPKCFNLTDAKWKWEKTTFMASIWCEHNDGIKWSGRVYQLTGAPKIADTPLTDADILSLDRKLTTRALTQSEMDALNAFSLSFAPTAKVINSTVNGVIVGPPKYERTANGTLGKAAGRASKDQACMPWSRLVDATGKPTSYYRLIGEEYYARCNVSGRYVKLGNQ